MKSKKTKIQKEIDFPNCPLEKLPTIGKNISKLLLNAESPFIVWLSAPMGAGKTTLVGYILKSMGLAKSVPVLSPTFTYMNEYEIKGKWYAHLDFYRAPGSMQIQDLGVLDAKDFAGIFVEWPESVDDQQSLKPTHNISIEFSEDRQSRNYRVLNVRRNVT